MATSLNNYNDMFPLQGYISKDEYMPEEDDIIKTMDFANGQKLYQNKNQRNNK